MIPNRSDTLLATCRRTASATAIICGLACGFILILLIVQFLRWSYLDRSYQQKILWEKSNLQSVPDPNQSIKTIRELDLAYRRVTFGWFRFSHIAARYLVGSAIGCLALTVVAQILAGPNPARSSPDQPDQMLQARFIQWSAIVAIIILASLAGISAVLPAVSIQTKRSQPAGPSQINWYRFRGPGGAGISPYNQIPVEFDGPSGKGILWKTPIRLLGNNSPIVWEDRLFVSGADANEFEVYGLDCTTGQILWTCQVPAETDSLPNIPEETGLASPTMATDGGHIYVIFATGALACIDMDGRLIWHKALGIPDSPYGYASSLEVFDDILIVQYDQGQPEDNKSRLLAFEGKTGRPLWQVPRPVGASWTSPITVQVNQQWQLITLSNPFVIAYQPATGQEIWRAKAVSGDLAPSAVYANGLVFVVEPYSKLVAIAADGRADVTNTKISWQNDASGPDICSPLCDGNYVYLLESSGMFTVIDLKGKLVYQKIIDMQFKASPTLIGNKILLVSEDGTVLLISAGPQYKELARYRIAEPCTASPAFSEGRMYIRTRQHLYCIQTRKQDNQD